MFLNASCLNVSRRRMKRFIVICIVVNILTAMGYAEGCVKIKGVITYTEKLNPLSKFYLTPEHPQYYRLKDLYPNRVERCFDSAAEAQKAGFSKLPNGKTTVQPQSTPPNSRSLSKPTAGRTIYTGPRGGRYYYSDSGTKVNVPQDGTYVRPHSTKEQPQSKTPISTNVQPKSTIQHKPEISTKAQSKSNTSSATRGQPLIVPLVFFLLSAGVIYLYYTKQSRFCALCGKQLQRLSFTRRTSDNKKQKVCFGCIRRLEQEVNKEVFEEKTVQAPSFHSEDTLSPHQQEKEIFRLAQQKGGRLTIADIAAVTSLSIAEAADRMEDIVSRGYAQEIQTSTGMMTVYTFGFVQEQRSFQQSWTSPSSLSSPDYPESGQIQCVIREKLLPETPEERVRQEIARRLIDEYDYQRKDIGIEFSIKMGSSTKRVDLVIFLPDMEHVQENIFAIIETKAPTVSHHLVKEASKQLSSYIAASMNCQYAALAWNEWRVFQVCIIGGYRKLQEIESFPRSVV